MVKERPLSYAQRRMLRGALEGNPYAGIRGQSAHGGAFGTVTSLVRRGLLTRDLKITQAGRAEIACSACGNVHELGEPIKGCVMR